MKAHCLAAVLAAFLLMVSVPSLATLGQDEDTADTDSAHLNAHRIRRPSAGYAVHEIQMPSGTVVREFVSPSGKVFAVTWFGPTLPDLAQIIGDDHFRTFLDMPAEQHVPRRLRRIQRGDLVVHSAGRPRAYSGYAFVPSLLPPGFGVDELR